MMTMPGTNPDGTPKPPSLPAERSAIPACKTLDPGPTYVRRLTRAEYRQTVRDLLSDSAIDQYILDFPYEEKRLNFDNNATVLSVSPLLTEQYMLTAAKLADTAVNGAQFLPNVLGGCNPMVSPEEMCWMRFNTSFVRKAFRRPPTAEEIANLRLAYDEGRKVDFATGIEMALAAVLQSPQFLYRIEVGRAPAKPDDKFVELTSHEVAARLSFLIWGTTPDTALRIAADADQLRTPEQIAKQVDRMLVETATVGTAPNTMMVMRPHTKARAVVASFHDQWLEIEKVDEVEKDPKTYPTNTFNKSHVTLMQSEIQKFVEEAFWGTEPGLGTLTALYTGNFTYATPSLFTFYGTDKLGLVGPPPPPPMPDMAPRHAKVMTDGVRRGGLLTQGALMILLSNPAASNPVTRGKFVREQLLCQHLQPPPNDIMVELPPVNRMLTTRERFNKHMEIPNCRGCHQLTDPIGYAFENFDAIGKWRDNENGKPIDATGEAFGSDVGKFKGAVELGKKLASSDAAAECVVRQWFRFGYGREEEDKIDDCTVELLKRKFIAGGLKFRDLVVALTQTDAFMFKRNVAPGGPQ
jgi:hypothetical protein